MGDAVNERLPVVDAATLARCLGVGPKEIYDLCKAGVLKRGAGRLFEVEGNVARYCNHLRRQMAGAASAAE